MRNLIFLILFLPSLVFAQRYPPTGSVPTYANQASLPSLAANGAVAITLDTYTLWAFDFGTLTWLSIGGVGVPLSVGSPANGLSIISNVISIGLSSASTIGALDAADWTTFNDKQPAGNYITALTGDVTASGPGSAAASLVATSNSTLTTLSGLTTASNLATIGTIGTGIWHGSIIGVTYGGIGIGTLSPHNVLVGNGTGAITQISPSTSGLVLTSNGTNADPSFQPVNAGTVTSVAVGTGLNASPSPITGSGTLTLANPTSSTIGGVEAYAAPTNQWLTGISTSGTVSSSQPAFSNISGNATIAQGGTNATSAAAGQIPNTSSTTASSWTSSPVLGVNGTTSGSVGIATASPSGATIVIENGGATTSYNFILPTTSGSAGQVLTSGGSGVQSWTTPASGSVSSISTGSGLTGGPITTSGTISLATTGTGAAFVQGGNSFGALETLGSIDNFGLALQTDSLTAMTITNAQKVGIGTTSPSNVFSVNGSASFGTYGSTTATVANSVIVGGNVGIGTSSPAGPLDVEGGTAGSGAGKPLTLVGQMGSAAMGGAINITAGAAGAASAGGAVVITGGAGGLVGGAGGNILLQPGGTNGGLESGVGIGTTSPIIGGGLTIAPPAQSGSTPSLLTITGPATTNLSASVEDRDINLNLARTVQFFAGALTTQRAMYVQAPSYGFVGASTLTTAATVDISGPPKSQTNATITNTYALNIEAGAVKPAGAVTNAYGMSVNAPTGATNNFAAIFGGGNVGIGTTSPNAVLDVNGAMRLEGSSSGYLGFQSPTTVTTPVTWTLPNGDGSANQVLSTNGSGTLSWSSAGTGTITSIGTTSPLTGGPITTSGTIGITFTPPTVSAATASGTGTGGFGSSLTGYIFAVTLSSSVASGCVYTNNGHTYTVASSVTSAATSIWLSGASAPTASGTLTYSSGGGSACNGGSRHEHNVLRSGLVLSLHNTHFPENAT
jgi:trimeric autotransporter adhesin